MNNLAIVQELYAAFAARDRARLLTILDPQIEWVQNEGFPGGGKHIGATVVLDQVFAAFRSEWTAWQAIVHSWMDAGDAIIALGEYRGTYKATGKSMTASFAHMYWLRHQRIVRFEQYTDTLKVAEAMSADSPVVI